MFRYKYSTECRICGKSVQQGTSCRPSEYCSKECREANKYLNAFKRCIHKIEFTEKYRKQLRGDLFSWINTNLQANGTKRPGTKNNESNCKNIKKG